jgi:glutamyl/glutaminyl-tRNA synthetase
VGGARTALFNLLYVRNKGGKMVLRLEDTDVARSSKESEEAICSDLQWLGLDWDEGPNVGGPGAPYRQSQRLGLYRENVDALLKSGGAYYAWESSDELNAMREAAQGSVQGFRYSRQEYSDEQLAQYRDEGRTPVVRCSASPGDIVFVDEVLGEITIPASDLDDFIILKGDGYPTYHMAVVVDDHHMGVTHVLRAQEHLKNTARHLRIYDLLGWEPPKHGHMPLIFSMEGGKMSKRDKAKVARAAARANGHNPESLALLTGLPEDLLVRFMKKKDHGIDTAVAIANKLGVELPEIDVRDFRESGYLPEALVNFLSLLGWSPGGDREIMGWQETVDAFSLDRIVKTAAKFDREKLRWLNGVKLRELSVDELIERVVNYVEQWGGNLKGVDVSIVGPLISLYRERGQTLRELDDAVAWVFTAPTEYGPAKAIKKHILKGDSLERLSKIGAILGSLSEWSEVSVETALTEFTENECEGKMGKVAQPVRIALTGSPVSPSIYPTIVSLSQAEVVGRISACVQYFTDSSHN